MSVFQKSIYLIFILLLSLSMNLSHASTVEAPEDIGISNVYYVNIFDPRDLYFISFSDNNNVWIYSLNNSYNRLETEFTLNTLTSYKHKTIMEHLKIVSEEPIMVISDIGYGVTYCPSTSGSFVGNSFIVFPPPDDVNGVTFLSNIEIWALESGIVEIRNETHVIPLPVFEDTFSNITLKISELHKSFFNISSDANIMLSTETGVSAIGKSTVGIPVLTAPSTTGQLVGRIHYGLGRYFMVSGRGSFQVIAYEPGVVTVTNLNDPSQSVIHEFTESGEVWHQANYDYISLKIEGDIDIFVQVGFGEDRIVSGNQPYIGGRATEDGQIEYWFYSGLITTPDEKQLGGIIFAPEDVTFILNDEEISLSADEYKILVPTEKLYYVVSSEPLVIYNGFLNGFALAPSGIPATKPEVTEEPVDNTMIYVAVAVAAIVIVAVLVFILKRKR